MTLALAALGLAAGVLTTLAGQGGGLFLLLASSAVVGPHAALALTAPALLVGNAHRAFMLRRSVDRGVAKRMIAGALPGALVGGMLAGAIPTGALRALLLALTLVVILKALGKLVFDVPRGALAPAGFVVGAMTGTAGGAGVLVAPILLATGLTGSAFVGTTSTIAVAMHAGRVVAYGATGLFARDLVLPTFAVAVSIALGNALAARVAYGKRRLPARVTTSLEYVVLAVCAVLSVAGVG